MWATFIKPRSRGSGWNWKTEKVVILGGLQASRGTERGWREQNKQRAPTQSRVIANGSEIWQVGTACLHVVNCSQLIHHTCRNISLQQLLPSICWHWLHLHPLRNTHTSNTKKGISVFVWNYACMHACKCTAVFIHYIYIYTVNMFQLVKHFHIWHFVSFSLGMRISFSFSNENGLLTFSTVDGWIWLLG